MLLRISFLICMILGPTSAAASGLAGDWVLRGTLVTNAANGFAIVQAPGSEEQEVIRVGSELIDGVTLVEVYAEYAMVQSGQGVYRMSFGDRINSEPISASVAHQVSWGDIPDLLEQLEVIPHQKEGRVIGYFINKIHGDIGEKVGLQPGDLLVAVNGVLLNDDLDTRSLLREFEQTHLNVALKRKGRDVRLSYQVSPL